jgi:hypothetical protein
VVGTPVARRLCIADPAVKSAKLSLRSLFRYNCTNLNPHIRRSVSMLRSLARTAKVASQHFAAAPSLLNAAPKAKFSSVMAAEIDAISGLTEEQQQVCGHYLP